MSKRFWSVLLSCTLLTISMRPASAADHVVPLSELQGKLRSTAERRAGDIADIERVLSYPAAADALRKSKVNPEQVRTAVATLSDTELARLAQQARASESDVQGGLIVGILALIGLIVVIIIVVSVVSDASPRSPAPDALVHS